MLDLTLHKWQKRAAATLEGRGLGEIAQQRKWPQSTGAFFMYLSLNRIDIELAAEGGRTPVLQTDHRQASEIAETRWASTIAALIRCLAPGRHDEKMFVIYGMEHRPPPFFEAVLAAASARFWLSSQLEELKKPWEPPALNEERVSELFNEAAQHLTEQLLRATEETDPFLLLKKLEKDFETDGFPSEDNETAYFTALLQLGILAGESIRRATGGVWQYSRSTTSTFPFIFSGFFRGEPATINPLGKSMKFLDAKGGGDEPSLLVRAIVSMQREAKT